jgi:hypothetical protein
MIATARAAGIAASVSSPAGLVPFTSFLMEAAMTAMVRSMIAKLVVIGAALIAARIALPEAASAQEEAPSSETEAAEPLALASGDFDRDGFPDLVTAYPSGDSGVVTLERGGSGALAVDPPTRRTRVARLASGAASISRGSAWAVPMAPAFLETADVDGDGRLDVVMAADGAEEIFWLPGDARGRFASPRRVELPGAVTAMAAGEVNRADGLIDLAVAVATRSGPRLLIFESPRGAFRDPPETLALAEEAAAVILGQLDDGYELDLAVATTSELLIVEGRDRRLSAFAERQETVAPPAVRRVPLSAAPMALAVGDFTGEWGAELAVLFEDGRLSVLERGRGRWRTRNELQLETEASQRRSARQRLVRVRGAASPKDALAVVDPDRGRLALVRGRGVEPGSDLPVERVELEGRPAAVLPMRLNADGASDLVVLLQDRSIATVVPRQMVTNFVITTTGDQSDPNLGTAFTFDLPPSEDTILITKQLPSLLGMVTIDGKLPFGAISRVTLDGSGAGDGVNGLELRGGDSVLQNLRVGRSRRGTASTPCWIASPTPTAATACSSWAARPAM